MNIGEIALPGNIILAPMAGVTDLPFRLLCKEKGADLVVTEMVSAKGIYYQNKNTEDLLRVDEAERPTAIQLFGSDPDIMSEMAKRIEDRNFDILDINMGCPVPKVVNNGEGSALLMNIPLAYQIMEKTVKAIKKPVTIKIRKGFHEGERTAVEMARAAEAAGISAIAVHGRTREEYYRGKADWSIIREIKENVSIPVIGNGDINSPEDVTRMMEETKCDGVMIGRAAKGNPWIFEQVKSYLKSRKVIQKPNNDEIIQMILRHTRMQIAYHGEKMGMRQMRSHVAWYTSGMPHSASLRTRINTIETYEELEKILIS